MNIFPMNDGMNLETRWWESLGLKYSRLNMIIFDASGSTAPMDDNRVLR
jgi:hypothetical protein